MRFALTFGEVEHPGDLAAYAADVRNAGGTVVESVVHEVGEEATMLVEADDRATFIAAFRELPSSEFCEGMDP